MPGFAGRSIYFGSFNVSAQVVTANHLEGPRRAMAEHKVFHITKHSFALVNLKPLLPGHILVCPLQVKPRLSDLTRDELSDLFTTTTRIQKTLQRLYKAEAFNVAVQDGEAAGQSIPHVHVHVIPRTTGDPGGGDKVHEWLEGEEGNVGRHQWEANQQERKAGEWPKDEARKPRTKDEMHKEAEWLESELAKDNAREPSASTT